MTYRTGRSFPIHVYEGDRPVATFHDPDEAARFVAAINQADAVTGFGVDHDDSDDSDPDLALAMIAAKSWEYMDRDPRAAKWGGYWAGIHEEQRDQWLRAARAARQYMSKEASVEVAQMRSERDDARISEKSQRISNSELSAQVKGLSEALDNAKDEVERARASEQSWRETAEQQEGWRRALRDDLQRLRIPLMDRGTHARVRAILGKDELRVWS